MFQFLIGAMRRATKYKIVEQFEVSIPYRCNETKGIVELKFGVILFQFLIGAMRRVKAN